MPSAFARLLAALRERLDEWTEPPSAVALDRHGGDRPTLTARLAAIAAAMPDDLTAESAEAITAGEDRRRLDVLAAEEALREALDDDAPGWRLEAATADVEMARVRERLGRA